MSSKKKDVWEIICPHCHSSLWIDAATRAVIQVEKREKKKESLEDLLAREEQRRATFDQKFEATAELERKKREKAREKFEKALGEGGED